MGTVETLAIPAGALIVSMMLFGVFIAILGSDPFEVYQSIYKGAFGSWFSWQNTLQRASPLLLVALCTALPARMGMIVIGAEGALVIGAVATVAVGVALAGSPQFVITSGMLLAGAIAGGVWIGSVGVLRHYRGVNETISSLLLNYIAIALMSHLVNGPMRDAKVQHRPSSWHVGEDNMIGLIPNMDVHWGLIMGIVACILTYVLMRHTITGFAADVAGGNLRAARMSGLPVGKLVVLVCFIGGAAAGLAGAVEIVAVHGRVSSSLVVGYGYTGILIAFIARQNPAAIIPVAILLGGIDAAGGLLQRWHDLPDATVLVMQGTIFVVILASEPLYGRLEFSNRELAEMEDVALGWWGVPLAVLGGMIRVSTPFLLVSLGECLTEKSGRINLGLEGNLVMGAMVGYAASYFTGSPWLGVLAAGCSGVALGAMHGWACSIPRVNDIAVGISLMLFGIGLAFFLGKPFIQPTAPRLPTISFGWWSDLPQVQAALQVNVLFIIGIALAPLMAWGFLNTRWGLIVRTVGESADTARSLGYNVNHVRFLSTIAGGFLAGVGGSYLSLYYPGSWNEGLSSGQGLMAVALVIFSRWDPMRCLYTALLFGGAGSLGPALQSVGISDGYYLFNAAPYLLTLGIMIVSCSPQRSLVGAPAELSVTK